MIDFLSYVRRFNPDSPHHIAAFNELARCIPSELLTKEADWVTMYNEQPTEWRYEFKERSDRQEETKG